MQTLLQLRDQIFRERIIGVGFQRFVGICLIDTHSMTFQFLLFEYILHCHFAIKPRKEITLENWYNKNEHDINTR